MSDLFERATKQKIRYKTSKGSITTEDLWDLKLTQLDTIAIALNRNIKERDEVSFVTKRSNVSSVIRLQFDVVKHVIEVKLAEDEAREQLAAKKAKKEFILSVIEEKDNEALKNKTPEELREMVASL